MKITKTPFRLSLFGGGTDYPSWFKKNESLVIAGAIDNYCYITYRKLPNFFDHLSRAVYNNVESVMNNSDFQHPSLRACLQFYNIVDGIEIHHDSDLPARTGIGSSSAFTVGLINAINDTKLSPLDLALKAIKIEQEILMEPVGVQDQIMSAFGGLQKIKLNNQGISEVVNLGISNDFKSYFESHLLLGYSGRVRFSSEHSSKIINKIENSNIDIQLTRTNSIAKMALNSFEKKNDIIEICDLLSEAWELKKEFSGNSIPEDIIDIYNIGIKSGAYAGKLMGAGGSGFFYFLAPPKLHTKIKDNLPQVKVWLPVKFSNTGSEIIYK
jgi:D-glycero-alpha-D-manno-heptose-7-phosphate kinase